MNLITDDWRLKLLAVGLAVLMLGAVAFSQNPPTSKPFTVPISYQVGPDLVLINPPTTTTVNVRGLADLIATLKSDSIVAVVDASKANPGPNVRLNVVAKSLVSGVTVDNPPPFAVNIDRLSVSTLTVQVVDHAAAGWEVTKADALCPTTPCVVHFSGPASWEVNLKAVAVFPNPIANSTYDVLTWPVTLEQGNITLDPGRFLQTVPLSSLDTLNVSLHIEARTGTTSRSVALVDSAPTHPPPAGYHVTGVVIAPVTIVLTGPADKLALVQNLSLPPVDLSSSTTNANFNLQIPFPSGMSGSVAVAKITYLISANPNASPSP
ncbi:MAG TPA: CdaR family protein [Candidatus Dormibacteraeota bacterium]|nr:CdaR family protein [Candidatus Dormibacteraeota bacterium]